MTDRIKGLFRSVNSTPFKRPLSILIDQLSVVLSSAVVVLCIISKVRLVRIQEAIILKVIIKLMMNNFVENF